MVLQLFRTQTVFDRCTDYFFFTVASLLCGLACEHDDACACPRAARLGGGAMQPLSQSILLESFPPASAARPRPLFGLAIVVAPISPTLAAA